VRSRGRILLSLVLAVALLGGGGAAYYFLGRKRPSPPAPQQHSLALADLIVNLADRDTSHHLSASVILLIQGAEPEKVVAEREAQIRDAVLMTMSQRSYLELLSAEGKESLKRQIATQVGEILAEDEAEVAEVSFTAFLMD